MAKGSEKNPVTATDRLVKALENLPMEQRVEILGIVCEICIGEPTLRLTAVKGPNGQ